MEKPMLILSVDTSCDDTSAAVTLDDRVISDVISSQIELHKKWGGVVPIIAKRAHEERIEAVVNEALKRATIQLNKISFYSSNAVRSKSPSQPDSSLRQLADRTILENIDAFAVT